LGQRYPAKSKLQPDLELSPTTNLKHHSQLQSSSLELRSSARKFAFFFRILRQARGNTEESNAGLCILCTSSW
jgi:hypothetical protein